MIELELPVTVDRYELVPDSGGAGEHRGGLAGRRDFTVLTDVVMSFLDERHTHSPWGLFGGLEGGRGRFSVRGRDGREREVYSKATNELIREGETVSLITPGGGGYGAPPPGYGSGYEGYPGPQKPPSSTPTVLSVIGIVCWFLCSPAAIVLGIIAQGKFRGQGKSDTLAKVAWIGGIVAFVLGVIVYVSHHGHA